MKLKHIPQLLGFNKRAKRYGYVVKEFNLQEHGLLRYAQWQHPSESPKEISHQTVAQHKSIISEGDFCIDIGAHTGDTTLPMALAAGTAGLTLALEPNPYVFPVLEKNVRLNRDKTNIVPLLAAAAQAYGEMEFEYSDSGFCNGGRHENISVLDHGHVFKLSVWGIDIAYELQTDFAAHLPKLRFIKTDAEGYDLYILQTLKDIIREYKPYLKAEVYKKSSAAYRRELVVYLKEMGYAVYHIAEEPFITGVEVTTENVMDWKHYDVFCIPPNKPKPR
ncbi:FkbM family methyltransferase [Cesiribacter sp. SM1]|uniref:FkbM family methyltransferase n=1 Tax=Cesiribacter sp. SM1 TaxID=2861196 RepID=UPI001CD79B86|nr:FkbM family methyltransferase [Cesiribacter sp. SM1]